MTFCFLLDLLSLLFQTLSSTLYLVNVKRVWKACSNSCRKTGIKCSVVCANCAGPALPMHIGQNLNIEHPLTTLSSELHNDTNQLSEKIDVPLMASISSETNGED